MALCFLLIVFEFPLRKLCASANLQGLRYPWENCNSCSMKHIPGLLPVKSPQRLTREPTRQYLETCGAACKREASCFCSRLWDHTIHGLCQDDTHFSQLIHLRWLASEPWSVVQRRVSTSDLITIIQQFLKQKEVFSQWELLPHMTFLYLTTTLKV